MSQSLGNIGTFSPVTPSSGYIGFYPCGQPITDTSLTDLSGKANHATLGANLTAANAWATSGKLSTAYGTNDGACIISAADINAFTAGADTLLFFCRAILTDPAANSGIFGTVTKGFRLRLLTTGIIDAVINYDAGDSYPTQPTGDFADATTEHSHMFVFDTVNLRMYVYNNAIANAAITSAGTIIAAGTMTNHSLGYRIGGISNVLTCAGKFRAVHVARKTGGVTAAQVAALANRLHRSSYVPLSETEWPAS